MSVNSPKKRGRPRAFEDEHVFRIISNLLLHGKITDVTLNRVAKLAGTTNQAISQRFSSKAGLLESYQAWLFSIVDEDIVSIRGAHTSPLQQYRALVVIPLNPRVLPNAPSNPLQSWTPIWIELDRIPALAEFNAFRSDQYNAMLLEIIAQAQEAGELQPVEPEKILELVWCVVRGAWSYDRRDKSEDTRDRMLRLMDTVLEPYILESRNAAE